MKNYPEKSLYFVLTSSYNLAVTTVEIAKNAILGGIDILQMREKNLSETKLIDTGKELAMLCKKNDVVFIVNDSPIIAKQVNADGVHLGQEDLHKFPLTKTRQILGQDKIIGLSTHSMEQFEIANESDLDYIAFGPIFPTKTKNYFIGTEDVEKVLTIAKKPIVFIGGINFSNIDILLNKGAKNIAVISAIINSANMTRTARQLKSKISDGEKCKL